MLVGMSTALGLNGCVCKGFGGRVTGAGATVLVRLTVARGAIREASEEEPVPAVNAPGDRDELPEVNAPPRGGSLDRFEELDSVAFDFEEELEVSPGTRKVRRETVSLAEAMERELMISG